MYGRVFLSLLFCLAAITAVVGFPAVASTGEGTGQVQPRIVGVFPIPATSQDRGECNVVSLPSGAGSANWTLTDGESKLRVPPSVPTENIGITDKSDDAWPGPEAERVALNSMLSLSNGGETVRLLRDGQVVDTVSYESAPEAE